jgi:hypothetical protein
MERHRVRVVFRLFAEKSVRQVESMHAHIVIVPWHSSCSGAPWQGRPWMGVKLPAISPCARLTRAAEQNMKTSRGHLKPVGLPPR